MRKALFTIVIGVLVIALSPRPAFAQDGCGLLSWLVGCDYEQRQQQIDNEHTEDMAQIEVRANEIAIDAQQQQRQLEYQRWLDSQTVQKELEQIAARERVDMAKIQYELERMYSDERTSQLQATTAFNVAMLQTDAMIAVANARRSEQTAAVVIALAVLGLAGALIYAARQYRRAAEVQAAPRLLPADDWQRRAVAMLEQKRVPWMLCDQRLLAQIDGEWVMVEKE